jgi:hypothetical protein
MTEPTTAAGIIPLAGGFGIIIAGSAIAVWLKKYKEKLRRYILRGSE